MITLQLTFKDDTVADLIKAAAVQGLPFNDYVEWRLNADLDSKAEEQRIDPDETVQQVAKALFREALVQTAAESDDEHTEEGVFYLVEELYKKLRLQPAWEQRDRGNRIMIGKAFKREVDAQQGHGTCLADDGQGPCVRVQFEGRTSQNQARYRTHRTA